MQGIEFPWVVLGINIRTLLLWEKGRVTARMDRGEIRLTGSNAVLELVIGGTRSGVLRAQAPPFVPETSRRGDRSL
jgi:hypothetical protein